MMVTSMELPSGLALTLTSLKLTLGSYVLIVLVIDFLISNSVVKSKFSNRKAVTLPPYKGL
jgi:hypothetical protein